MPSARNSEETCRALAADVTVHDQVKQVVAATQKAFGGRIDVLINVAGVTGAGSNVEDITEETWDFVFAVNCKGTFLFIKEVVPPHEGCWWREYCQFLEQSQAYTPPVAEQLR